MRFECLAVLATFVGTCGMIGCGEKATPTPSAGPATPSASAASGDEAKFTAEIAKLPEDERTIATAQKFCAVENNSRLGSMGKPYKILIEDQPVFLCCAGCEDEARKDPKKTLSKVDELKAASK